MTPPDDAPESTSRRSRRRPTGKRRRAREIAVQMLYQHEIGDTPLARVFDGFDLDEYVRETELAAAEGTANAGTGSSGTVTTNREAFDYARRLAQGTLDHGSTIDERIRAHAENWRLERMPVIDRNILRLAIYEMFHETGVPKVVIVDEAIELAKKFGSEHSGRFVNGLLDGVLKASDGGGHGRDATPRAGTGDAG